MPIKKGNHLASFEEFKEALKNEYLDLSSIRTPVYFCGGF